jgi:hypothetical protein
MKRGKSKNLFDRNNTILSKNLIFLGKIKIGKQLFLCGRNDAEVRLKR